MSNGDAQSSVAPNSPSKKRTYYFSDEEEFVCPLCMEEMDLSDRNFRPCPCGYQENLNSRCPACRRIYSVQTIEFTPISAEELARIKNEKKQKEREKKEVEAMNRKHLSNMRVVQKNLVYVIGLSPKTATEEVLRSHDYFGQYGKIAKIVVNRRNPPASTVPGAPPPQPSVGVYITYVRKEDAAKAIDAVDGSMSDGKVLRASYGTTKYCTYYLRNMVCQNPNCMYLHEPGEEADSYTKEDLASVKYHLKEQESHKVHEPHKAHESHKVIHDIHKVVDSHKAHQTHPPQSRQSQPPHSVQKSIATTSPLVLPHRKSEPATQPRVVGPESDRGSNDERDEASALPPTASWAAAKTQSPEISPILLQQSITQHPPPSIQHSTTNNNTQQASQHPPIASQSSQSHNSLQPQSEQEPKLKRTGSLDAQSLGTKQQEKKTNELTVAQVAAIPSQRKEIIDHAKEKVQHVISEPSREGEHAEQSSQQSSNSQLKDKLPNMTNRHNPEIEDFDQTLSVLSDGSFAFSFNPPSLDVSLSITEKHAEKASGPSELGVLGSSRIVSPPPGVGFPNRSDAANSQIVANITDPEFPQSSLSSYTGSFNPFSSEEEKFDPFGAESPLGIMGIPSVGNNSISEAFQTVSKIQTLPSNNSASNKSRQSSRFGFALEDGDNSSSNNGDPLAMKDLQEGFRALFPNVNISFGPSDVHQESMWNTSNDPSFPSLRRPVMTAPPGVPPPGVPIGNPLNQSHSLNTSTSTAPMEHHFHQNFLMQHHQPPQIGLGPNPPPTIKAPPPGIYQPSPRMPFGLPRGPSKDDPHNFFTEFLKAAAASSNIQEDIQAPVQNVGGHRLSVFERVARTGDEQINGGFGMGIGLGNVEQGINNESSSSSAEDSEQQEPKNQLCGGKDRGLNLDTQFHHPSPNTKDNAEKPTTQQQNHQSNSNNRSAKPAAVIVNRAQQSRQDSNVANQTSAQIVDAPPSSIVHPVPGIYKKKDKHPKNANLNAGNNKQTAGTNRDSKKHGNSEGQAFNAQATTKSKDISNQNNKGAAPNNPENNSTKSSSSSNNNNPVIQSPILSKKPKKKDKNIIVAVQQEINPLTGSNEEDKKQVIEKDYVINELVSKKVNTTNDQRDDIAINNKDSNGTAITSIDSKTNFLADFKFDFASSAFFTMPPGISTASSSKKDQNADNQSPLLDENMFPTSATFDLLSAEFFPKDSPTIFSFPTSTSYNPSSTSAVTHFNISFGCNPGTWNNASTTTMTRFTPMNNVIGASNNNETKISNASVEDLERQVANARREAEILEHRLRAVIKKNTHHLQDAWK
ncbi:5882_t:CDS:10 [Ambispora gerdemannii]|uniref:5882_t:CDS:1 n=1 Tax=Ambispora gerdemannii TaxID=144530 RepID=A0A9N9AY28_9GLOM|nr:5882_t:CDS:10 [Ambispora gerdemannii]